MAAQPVFAVATPMCPPDYELCYIVATFRGPIGSPNIMGAVY
jgi:hypothetical protein